MFKIITFYLELAKDIFRWLALIFNNFWNNPDVAKEEQKGSIVPVFKKE